MRINHITDHFVRLNTRSGCYMHSIWHNETKTMALSHRGSGNLIAEIYDYTDANNFRLRLHPNREKYARSSHTNRLCAVLTSVQKSNGRDWDSVRYSSFIRYAIKVWDRKLTIEYELKDLPLEFAMVDGKLTIDYRVLESGAFPNATPAPVVEPNTNDSLRSVSSRLTTILQGV
jgi:hypothetical protein